MCFQVVSNQQGHKPLMTLCWILIKYNWNTLGFCYKLGPIHEAEQLVCVSVVVSVLPTNSSHKATDNCMHMKPYAENIQFQRIFTIIYFLPLTSESLQHEAKPSNHLEWQNHSAWVLSWWTEFSSQPLIDLTAHAEWLLGVVIALFPGAWNN